MTFRGQGKTKAPQECGADTKTQNIDMKAAVSRPIFQYFSIFLSGCKQPNLSTFPAVSQGPCAFSGCKDTQKNQIPRAGCKNLLNYNDYPQ